MFSKLTHDTACIESNLSGFCVYNNVTGASYWVNVTIKYNSINTNEIIRKKYPVVHVIIFHF